MPIQVTLEDHTGRRRQAKLSETATADRLVESIVSALQLPLIDASGERITYYLRNENGQTFKEKDTLRSRNVQTHEVLTLVPEMTEPGLVALESDQHAADEDTLIDTRGPDKTLMVSPLLMAAYPGSDSPGNVPARMPLDSTTPVEQLVQTITARLRLPTVDAEARPILYRLRHQRRFLRADETLWGRGITDNDTLVLEHILPTTSSADVEATGGWWDLEAERSAQTFLISYHHDDFVWARWVATQLQEHEQRECSLMLFDCDARIDENFAQKMHDAVEVVNKADRMIALLSHKYLQTLLAKMQVSAAAARDPGGEHNLLLPIYIEDCSDELAGE